jgi:DNA-3-methyladenine glycosylase
VTSISPLHPAYPPVTSDFFLRDARHLARALIGAYVVRSVAGSIKVSRVVETEAYRGPKDAACHARAGLTRRTRSLLGPPGHAYVFLVYGMHECFNVVCLGEGRGHAVLVRAGEPTLGFAPGVRLDGPGRFARALGITRADDDADLMCPPTYLSPRSGRRRLRIGVTPRVGVAYAGLVADKPWRFFDPASPHVSRPPRSAIGRGLCPSPPDRL